MVASHTVLMGSDIPNNSTTWDGHNNSVNHGSVIYHIKWLFTIYTLYIVPTSTGLPDF